MITNSLFRSILAKRSGSSLREKLRVTLRRHLWNDFS